MKRRIQKVELGPQDTTRSLELSIKLVGAATKTEPQMGITGVRALKMTLMMVTTATTLLLVAP